MIALWDLSWPLNKRATYIQIHTYITCSLAIFLSPSFSLSLNLSIKLTIVVNWNASLTSIFLTIEWNSASIPTYFASAIFSNNIFSASHFLNFGISCRIYNTHGISYVRLNIFTCLINYSSASNGWSNVGISWCWKLDHFSDTYEFVTRLKFCRLINSWIVGGNQTVKTLFVGCALLTQTKEHLKSLAFRMNKWWFLMHIESEWW